MKYLVDGNNLLLSCFEGAVDMLGLEKARENLVAALRFRFRVREQDTLELLFDGGDARAADYDEGVSVRFVRNADDAIVERIAGGISARVVTDDAGLRTRVRRAGGSVIKNVAFLGRFDLSEGLVLRPPRLRASGESGRLSSLEEEARSMGLDPDDVFEI